MKLIYILNDNPGIVSLIGFVITIFSVFYNEHKRKNEKVAEIQRELYIDCYSKIEELMKNNALIFDENYFETIRSFQGKIKIIGSNRVVKCYKSFLEFVWGYYRPYVDYQHKEDPLIDVEASCSLAAQEDNLPQTITQEDLDNYLYKMEKYREEHLPEPQNVRRRIEALLQSMRKDFGTDKYNV